MVSSAVLPGVFTPAMDEEDAGVNAATTAKDEQIAVLKVVVRTLRVLASVH